MIITVSAAVIGVLSAWIGLKLLTAANSPTLDTPEDDGRAAGFYFAGMIAFVAGFTVVVLSPFLTA